MFCCARAYPVVYECGGACVGAPRLNADAQEANKPKASRGLSLVVMAAVQLFLMGFLL